MQITCIPQSSTNTILISIEKLIACVSDIPVNDLTGWSPSSIYGEFLRVINSKKTDDLVCHYTMPSSQLIALCDYYNQLNPDFNHPPIQPKRDQTDKMFEILEQIANKIKTMPECQQKQELIEKYKTRVSLALSLATPISYLSINTVTEPAKHPVIIEIFTKLNRIRENNTPRPIVGSRSPLSFFCCRSDDSPRTARESSELLASDSGMGCSSCQLL